LNEIRDANLLLLVLLNERNGGGVFCYIDYTEPILDLALSLVITIRVRGLLASICNFLEERSPTNIVDPFLPIFYHVSNITKCGIFVHQQTLKPRAEPPLLMAHEKAVGLICKHRCHIKAHIQPGRHLLLATSSSSSRVVSLSEERDSSSSERREEEPRAS
jgi:hypothetical protein